MLEFNEIQTLAVAILAYFIGRKLTKRFRALYRASVPEAVTGGLVIAMLVGIVQAFDVSVHFTMTGRDTLLLVVFAIVGLQAKASRLMEGGRPLLILVGFAVLMLPVQNLIGMGTAWLFGEPLAIGLMGGLAGRPSSRLRTTRERAAVTRINATLAMHHAIVNSQNRVMCRRTLERRRPRERQRPRWLQRPC